MLKLIYLMFRQRKLEKQLKKGEGEYMKAVRIVPNENGTFSAYIYDQCIYTGTYGDCVEELSFRGEYV